MAYKPLCDWSIILLPHGQHFFFPSSLLTPLQSQRCYDSKKPGTCCLRAFALAAPFACNISPDTFLHLLQIFTEISLSHEAFPGPHLKQQLLPTLPIPLHCFIFLFNVYHHLTYFNYTCLSVIVHLPLPLNEGRNFVCCMFTVLAPKSRKMASNNTWICEYLMLKEQVACRDLHMYTLLKTWKQNFLNLPNEF